MADNKTATLTGSDGTAVDILLTRAMEFSMDKQLIIIAYPKQSPPLTWIIDLKKLRETITINGILLDENSESAKTKFNNLRTIMQNEGQCTLAWGASSEFSYSGSVIKCTIRQIQGKMIDTAATLGSRTDTFEIMLQFSIGTVK